MAAGTSRRPGRSTGSVYGVVVLALVVVLASLAWTVRQPPPPTIVAFAPGAVHQIKRPPPNQAAKTGTRAGNGGTTGTQGKGPGSQGKGPSGGPPPPPVTVHVPNVVVPAQFQCVGTAPYQRQIEDPQSPPCVSYWKGNNGGATAFGVTANQI
ncbi:MAG: hypothetical protein ACYDAQ_20485, partial [Mycobacteriales bacterium]